MRMSTVQRASERIWIAQALYYLGSGIWPLIDIRSFEALTGPKTDRWLVKTVGVVVAAIGATVGMAGVRRRITPEIVLLATASGSGLAAIDVIYVARRRISSVYLLDAVVHLVILACWTVMLRRTRRH